MNLTKISALTLTSILLFSILSCKKIKITPKCSTCTSCVSDILDLKLGLTGYLESSYCNNDSFYFRNKSSQYSPFMRNKNGYYGVGGASINTDLTKFMPSNLPSTMRFVIARMPNIGAGPDSTLMNIKFQNTPLIITTLDSLSYYLKPYGYSVKQYSYPSQVYSNNNPVFTNPSKADSIVITSKNLIERAIVGAYFFESEIRNICFSK